MDQDGGTNTAKPEQFGELEDQIDVFGGREPLVSRIA